MATFDLGAYRAVLAIREFRLFWLGFALSVLGDAMTKVALTWIVYQETGSGRAIGLLMVCYTAPILVGGLTAGWLLDRFDRRRIMALDNLLRGGAVATIPLAAALDALTLTHVYLVAASYGLLMMLSLAGSPALIPSLVPPEQRSTANALEMLGFTLGGIVGPPLAGLLIGIAGAANVALLDALSYALFAAALLAIPAGQTTGAAAARARHGLGAAVRLLTGNQVLLATTLMFMLFNLGSGFLYVALPVYSDRTLGGGALLYGVLLGVLAAGQVVSALASGAVSFALPLGTLICLAQGLAGFSLLLLLPGNLPLAALALFAYGLFSSPLTVWAQTLRMRIIPEELRGRAFALLRTLMQGGGPVGSGLAGLLLPALGLGGALALGGLLAGAPGVAGIRVRALRAAGPPATVMPAAEPAAALATAAEDGTGDD